MTYPVGRFQVFVTDHLNLRTEITNFEEVDAIENDLARGAWRVLLNVDQLNNRQVVEKIMATNRLGIEIVDNDTGWRYGGPATYRQRIYGSYGQITSLELRGVDWMDLFDAYIALPVFSDPLQAWIHATATTFQSELVGNIVTVSLVTDSIEDRRVAMLRGERPDPPQGPERTAARVGQVISDMIVPWFTDSLWSYRININRTPDINELLFTTYPRATSPTIITPTIQTGITVTERAAAATWVVAKGALTEDDTDHPERRYVAVEEIPTENWLTRRRERLVNRPAAASDEEVANEAASELATAGPQRLISVPDFNLPGYGLTTKLGDFVQINYDDNEDVALVPITSSRLEGTPRGWERTLSVGDDIPVTPTGVTQAQIAVLAKRIRNLEGFL